MQTRERLTELEIPHLYKNCARNSMKRGEITEKWGAFSPALFPSTTLSYTRGALQFALSVLCAA